MRPSRSEASAIWVPSGDQAWLRFPGPQLGGPTSASSGTRWRARPGEPDAAATSAMSRTQRFDHPPRSETYARRVPSGENRGSATETPGPPSTIQGSPPERRATIRLASQGMSGASHSCQTTLPSGARSGLKQKSPPVLARAGQRAPSSPVTPTSMASPLSSWNASQPLAQAGAAWPGPRVTRRGTPPAAGTAQSSPPMEENTISAPSGVHANAPPP